MFSGKGAVRMADYAKVKSILETTVYREANCYLQLGWKLIGFYTTAYDAEMPGAASQTPHYCLGWFNDLPAAHPETEQCEYNPGDTSDSL